MIDLGILTTIHTTLSIIALFLGVPAVLYFFDKSSGKTMSSFLGFAAATSITGFFFPFHAVTPAIIVGVVALIVLAFVYAAQYAFHLTGPWRKVYASGVVISEYLLVFVSIAQAFSKIPFLHNMAPTLSEPPFGIAQITALIFFGVVGYKALRKF